MNDIPHGRRPGVPEPQDGIFLPVETMSERTLEAITKRDEAEKKVEALEQESAKLRRSRSRFMLSAIIFGAMFLSALAGSAIAYLWATDSIESAQSERDTKVQLAEQVRDQAIAERDATLSDNENLQGQIQELTRYRDLRRVEIAIENARGTLENDREAYANATDSELLDILAREPEDWSLSTAVQAGNWSNQIETRLNDDLAFYEQVIEDVNDWRIRQGQPRRTPQPCPRTDPWEPVKMC